VAFEDAAGCPACLSLSLPRGDGNGDGVRGMLCKHKDKSRVLATFHHAKVVDKKEAVGKKKRAIISTMIVYDCGCIEVSRLPVLLDDELMKWIR
jgi:hypothetical protein